MVGQRIKQARIAAGLSLRQLADETDNYVSAQVIHKYELGKSAPGSDVLLRLAKALGVKVEFFFRPATSSATLSTPAFRKRSKTPAKELKSIRGKAKEWIEKYLEVESLFPANRFTPFRRPKESGSVIRHLDEIEDFAATLRKQWMLGTDPIEKLVEVLEDRGIKVAMVDTEAEIDGLSCWANDSIPLILVKRNQNGDRLRFSIAHELGHLLLRTSERIDAEAAANRFAGAFLVPKDSVIAELGEKRQSFSFYELISLREKYGMSVQAWLHRSCDLGIISTNLYAQLCRFLRQKGLSEKEVGKALPPESATRFERLVVQAVEEDLISQSKGAELLDVPLIELRKNLQAEVLDAQMRG